MLGSGNLILIFRKPGYMNYVVPGILSDFPCFPLDFFQQLFPILRKVLEFILPVDPMDRMERSKVKELFRDASLMFFKQGAYYSRPYGIWADMVYKKDAKTVMVMRKVKKIFDQNNVMNPGKLCF